VCLHDIRGSTELKRHPHEYVKAPLAAYHETTRQLSVLQDALFQTDKDLSLAVGRARDAMDQVSLQGHAAIDAMAVNPVVAQLRAQKRGLEEQIADLRPVLAEREYALTVARQKARQDVAHQLNRELAPALAAMLEHLQALEGPNARIVDLERHRQRLLMQAADSTLTIFNLHGSITRLKKRLEALAPAEAEAPSDTEEVPA
jgi:chromosome segregation ATPase